MTKLKNIFVIKIPKTINCFVCSNKNIIILKKKNTIFLKKICEIDFLLHKSFLFFSCNDKLLINTLKNLICSIKDFIKKKEINFYKKLTLNGVGYRFNLTKDNPDILNLLLGYSHMFYVKLPSEINMFYLNHNNIYLVSKNYIQLNLVSNIIKSLKYPDPYKGKGIVFEYDVIKLKEGKKIQ